MRLANEYSWVFILLAVLVGPAVALIYSDPYMLNIFERILIMAVAAASLNLILGYGGMVSFGHAVFLGIGAYASGVLSNAGFTSLPLQLPVVIVASALVGLFIGATALRTTGIHFIMISLALAQIFYYLAISSSSLGGDDGLVIYERVTLGPLLDPWDYWQFYAFVAVSAALLLGLVNRVIASEFGQRLMACHENPRRAEAIGLNSYGTRLTAFVLAGIVCGLAGSLLANQAEIASPGNANWHRSGELLAIVIFGGVGTRNGPILGAFAFILLEHHLSGLTRHWAMIFGPILILAVLFSPGGLAQGLERVLGRIGARRQRAAP